MEDKVRVTIGLGKENRKQVRRDSQRSCKSSKGTPGLGPGSGSQGGPPGQKKFYTYFRKDRVKQE